MEPSLEKLDGADTKTFKILSQARYTSRRPSAVPDKSFLGKYRSCIHANSQRVWEQPVNLLAS